MLACWRHFCFRQGVDAPCPGIFPSKKRETICDCPGPSWANRNAFASCLWFDALCLFFHSAGQTEVSATFLSSLWLLSFLPSVLGKVLSCPRAAGSTAGSSPCFQNSEGSTRLGLCSAGLPTSVSISPVDWDLIQYVFPPWAGRGLYGLRWKLDLRECLACFPEMDDVAVVFRAKKLNTSVQDPVLAYCSFPWKSNNPPYKLILSNWEINCNFAEHVFHLLPAEGFSPYFVLLWGLVNFISWR